MHLHVIQTLSGSSVLFCDMHNALGQLQHVLRHVAIQTGGACRAARGAQLRTEAGCPPGLQLAQLRLQAGGLASGLHKALLQVVALSLSRLRTHRDVTLSRPSEITSPTAFGFWTSPHCHAMSAASTHRSDTQAQRRAVAPQERQGSAPESGSPGPCCAPLGAAPGPAASSAPPQLHHAVSAALPPTPHPPFALGQFCRPQDLQHDNIALVQSCVILHKA